MTRRLGGGRGARGRARPDRDRPASGRAVLIRAWIVFFGVLALFQALVVVGNGRLVELAIHANAWLVAGALWLLGADGQARGSLVTSSVFDAEIIFECTAAYPIAMWVGAVLAYPAGWRPKLLGLALGVPALVLLNVVRLVSLFYLGHWWRSAFETAHLLVWQSLLIFLTVLLWLLWAATLARQRESRPA